MVQTYVDLAEQSCNFPDDGSLLNMCSIKEGLEVLNVRQVNYYLVLPRPTQASVVWNPLINCREKGGVDREGR